MLDISVAIMEMEAWEFTMKPLDSYSRLFGFSDHIDDLVCEKSISKAMKTRMMIVRSISEAHELIQTHTVQTNK